MAEILVSTEVDIRVITARGDLTQPELVALLKQEYPKIIERLILWDLSEATMNHVTIEQLREIAALVGRVRVAPEGARTAYVATDTRAFTLICMYTAEATMARSHVDYSAFRRREDAVSWLRGKSS